MWNLDCSVGKGGANSISADVSFLQWYYTLAANFHLTTPENKAVYRKVKITGTLQRRRRRPAGRGHHRAAAQPEPSRSSTARPAS